MVMMVLKGLNECCSQWSAIKTSKRFFETLIPWVTGWETGLRYFLQKAKGPIFNSRTRVSRNCILTNKKGSANQLFTNVTQVQMTHFFRQYHEEKNCVNDEQ